MQKRKQQPDVRPQDDRAESPREGKPNAREDNENPRGPDGRPINPQKTDTPGSGQF